MSLPPFATRAPHLARALGAALCVLLLNVCRAQDESGFESLFNGKDLAGWGGPTDGFEVKEGALTCRPDDGGTIYTRKRYSDFVLRLDFKLPAGSHAAIALRYPGSGHPAYVGMCQIQLGDEPSGTPTKPDARRHTGAAYGLVAAKPGSLRPAGEWNAAQITARGSTLEVELNGNLILKADLAEVTEFMDNHPHPGKARTSGHVGIVAHTEPVWFRNVRIKPLR